MIVIEILNGVLFKRLVKMIIVGYVFSIELMVLWMFDFNILSFVLLKKGIVWIFVCFFVIILIDWCILVENILCFVKIRFIIYFFFFNYLLSLLYIG